MTYIDQFIPVLLMFNSAITYFLLLNFNFLTVSFCRISCVILRTIFTHSSITDISTK